jgi:hypothetical protein
MFVFLFFCVFSNSCIMYFFVSPFVYSCLFLIFLQVYRLMCPGGNPTTVNKYNIVYIDNYFISYSLSAHNAVSYIPP